MLSWLLESFFVLAIVQIAMANHIVPCKEQRVIYESSPDYGYDSGNVGYVSRVNILFLISSCIFH